MKSNFSTRVRKLVVTSLSVVLLSSPLVVSNVHAQAATEASTQQMASTADRPFSINSLGIKTDGGTAVSVEVTPVGTHDGLETVVFELLKGDTPTSIVAIKDDITSKKELSANFNITGSDISVKVFVVDSYSGSLTEVGTNLADPITIRPTVSVKILGINDFHGQLDTTTISGSNKLGTAPILATYLKEYKAKNPNTLLVHNGDSVGASAPVSSLERDKPTLEFLNMMHFDVGTLGNHEFDQGVPSLMSQIYGGVDPANPAVTHVPSEFPIINANVVDADTGENILPSYYIKEIGGVKVGFIGVVTMETVNKVAPSALKGVKLVAQAPVVNAAVKELQEKGIHAIVVLAHDPASASGQTATGEAAELAKVVDPDVDVIFAGDNHAKVNATVNGKLIVQANSYGTAFADVNLEIDPVTGDVVKKQGTIVDVNQKDKIPDPEVEALIKKYQDAHPELTQPVGTTDGSIKKSASGSRSDSALGNIIADAMRDDMQTDIAFMNPGGIRADMPSGDVTFGDLAKIQPFGNALVKMDLTGTQIKLLLQQQWTSGGGGIMQISGFKYKYDSKKSVDQRVSELTLSDGTPIEDDKSYSAVVNNFMAAGGDKYFEFVNGSDQIVGRTDLDVFYDYILKTFNRGPITAPTEPRIVDTSKL